MHLERNKGVDLVFIGGGFLLLFLLAKVQKNIHYLLSQHFLDAPAYLQWNLFDFFVLGASIYCIWKRVDFISFFRSHKSLLFLLLFLIWTRITLFKVDPMYLSRAHVLFFGFFTACLCLPLLSLEFFRKKIFDHFYTLLGLVVIFSSIECLVGLSQFALQKPLNLPFLQEWQSLDSLIVSGRSLSELYIGQLLNFPETAHLILRSYGTMSHPNILGGFLSFACLALYFLYLKSTSAYQKAAIFFLLFVHIITLFTTFSRSSGLSFLLLTFLFFFYSIKKLSYFHLFSLIGVVTLCCTSGLILFSSCAIDRACSLPISSEKMALNTPRIRGFLVAKEMIVQNPFSGVGHRQFVNKMAPYISKENAAVEKLPAHNIYLLIAAESGLIGFFLFSSLLFFALKELYMSPFCGDIHFFLFGALMGQLLVGLFDCYPLTSFFSRMAFFSILGLGSKTIIFQKEPRFQHD